MQFKKKLLVFPTHRSIRTYLSKEKENNKLLPFCITIDEFLKKSITLSGKKYCEEEQRVLFLNEAIKNTNISKLGISSEFSNFLKQSDYIYRFLLEISSEKIDIEKIKSVDTYEFYIEHLSILEKIKHNYEEILEKENFIDRINLSKFYKINKRFINKFDCIELYFEGYFTKIEFDIIEKISSQKELSINFYSNDYNKKSISIFNDIFDYEFKSNYEYKINLTKKEIINEIETKKVVDNFSIKGFSSRLNQIAFIKNSIVDAVNSGINPSNIAVVLPDENFAQTIQLFDNEKYFNYAMGKSIKNYKLYQISHAIHSYISDDEVKHVKNLEYLGIKKEIIDETIKKVWKHNCSKDLLEIITTYIKNFENNDEVLEKFNELLYKLNILIFSTTNKILVKDVFKVLLQKISSITLDDVNSGKITVLGLLETRAVAFDCVIICDFNEDYIPKKSVKDKFLSTNIKQNVGLPTSSDRESLQKYYYKRLCDSTKRIYISYVKNDTSQISRFANELFDDKINSKNEDNSYKHILYNNHSISYLNEEIIDKIDLSKFTWSATSFKTYLECKRKFYLNYILKIKEHDISLKPKSYELGNIIHNILEEYYNQDFRDFSIIEELFNKYKTSNAFLTLDLEIWKKRLYQFYKIDNKRLETRKIIGLEKQFNSTFDGIKIKGTIDRIDKYEDRYEVLDYKTSSSLKVDSIKTSENSKDFQLEFYYIAMNDIYKSDNIDCFYYDLSTNSLKQEVALDRKLELLSQKFDELKEISKKEISFTKCEEKSTCQYCPYKIMCDRE
jgi:RecB family exonuclease